MSVTFSMISTPAVGSTPCDEFLYEELDVNVANANACTLLDVLGYADNVAAGDLCGIANGEDFLGRVLMAQAVRLADAGIPVCSLPSEGMRLLAAGRPGYVQDRLADLRTLAQVAAEWGHRITWA